MPKTTKKGKNPQGAPKKDNVKGRIFGVRVDSRLEKEICEFCITHNLKPSQMLRIALTELLKNGLGK